MVALATCMSAVACSPDATVAPPPAVLRDTTISNVTYGAAPGQVLDLALPRARDTATALVVVLHGGSWTEGDKSELTFIAQGLKLRGFAVANMNYRLAPQAGDNFAMQLDDIALVIAWLRDRAATYGYGKSRVYLVGHSAGAQLALTYAYTRNASGLVRGVGSLSAVTNLYGLVLVEGPPYAWQALTLPLLTTPLLPLTPATQARYQSASPLYTATDRSPPTILFHGDADLAVLFTESTSMAIRLSQLNVPQKFVLYGPNIGHTWWSDAPRTTDLLDQLASWFNDHP